MAVAAGNPTILLASVDDLKKKKKPNEDGNEPGAVHEAQSSGSGAPTAEGQQAALTSEEQLLEQQPAGVGFVAPALAPALGVGAGVAGAAAAPTEAPTPEPTG